MAWFRKKKQDTDYELDPSKGTEGQDHGVQLDEHGQPNPVFNASRRIVRSIDELLGVCQGILLDGVVTEDEAINLDEWIRQHPEIVNEWPVDVIAARLDRIFEDNVVTNEEREDLKYLLQQVTGTDPEDVALGITSASLPLDDPPPDVHFANRSFCFTGRFFFGARRECQKAIERCGGWPQKGITRDLDYLVVGLVGSRDWVHSSFGRKIEKAIAYREKGALCAIISEKHWASQLP